jgi:hypothetical protein
LRADIRVSLAKKHHNELVHWREGIAQFLDVESSLLNPLFQRQSNVLRLAYAHALLLIHRPFLLSNFENLTRQDSNSKINDVGAEVSVKECLKAAMNIVGIVNEICEVGQMFRAFWVSCKVFYNLLVLVAYPRILVYPILCVLCGSGSLRLYYSTTSRFRRRLATVFPISRESSSPDIFTSKREGLVRTAL